MNKRLLFAHWCIVVVVVVVVVVIDVVVHLWPKKDGLVAPMA